MSMTRLLSALARRLRREQDGVTMYLVLGLMLVTSLLISAVLVGTSSDASLSRRDLDLKKATYAAQAGVAAFLQQLNANPNYWTTCQNSSGYPATTPVANSSTGDESYSYKLIPAQGQTACDPNNPTTSMITAAGTFRVQFNGFSGVSNLSSQPESRSLIVTFKHDSFLNYVWFTQYEQQNPSLDSSYTGSGATQYPSVCVGQTVQQIYTAQASGSDMPCVILNDTTGEDFAGPMFSDDYFLICGTPTFGAMPSDNVYTKGFVDNSGCSNNSPNVNTPPSSAISNAGTLQTTYKPLTIPQSNDTLEKLAQLRGTVYTGVTYVTLAASGYTVTNANVNGGSPTSESYPANGVMYVAQDPNRQCSYSYSTNDENYSEYQTGGTGAGCGTVFVSGTYGQSLTIASSQDIVVTGSLISGASNALLGLVPQDWARVYHEVRDGSGAVTSCNADSGASNAGSDFSNPTIDAAILATTDSWIVDNYTCGSGLGSLNVVGAIAQYYRGPVGRFGSSQNGYQKNYSYDRRLQEESPPYFLSPVNPAWSIQSEGTCTALGHIAAGTTSFSNSCY